MPLTKRMALRLGELSLRRWAIGIAILSLGVSGLFGGWEKAQADTKVAAVGQAVEGGPWRVTVTKAQLHGTLPPMVLRDKTNHWVVVVAIVEITADESWTTLTRIIKLSGVDGVKDEMPQVILVRDSTRISRLHPGMPEEVAFFWERSGTVAPQQVTVEVNRAIWRQNTLNGADAAKEWMPEDEPKAAVKVPVVDKRAAA